MTRGIDRAADRRPAVDLAPEHARPGLALVLALLAVPGSTVAWALPAGGFWIGLPLGIAAIVLGLRARRHAPSAAATAAVVIAGLAIGFMAVWTVVDAVADSGDRARDRDRAVARDPALDADQQPVGALDQERVAGEALVLEVHAGVVLEGEAVAAGDEVGGRAVDAEPLQGRVGSRAPSG